MSASCTIRVLGPIDVMTTSGVQAVGGHRQQALLGALVLGAGRAVSTDELSQAIWRDGPPRTAANTLQSYVSNIRHLLGTDAIARADHSYQLDVDLVDVDAVEFERLIRHAEKAVDPDDRWRACHDALALWRGRPFGDLADDEAFELETMRLEELRLATMELSLEADLALGRHDVVVAELECAVREHPYRERLWYLLIDAFVQGGRRVEALQTCREFRAVLTDAGIGAGDELDEVERHIRVSRPAEHE